VSSGSNAIGPTAQYTGHVWARNGLSHPALDTNEGHLLYGLWQPPMLAARLIGAPTIESALLARHLAIDSILERAIAKKEVAQVVEVACGMSPRGWRFTERHPGLVYVETDLPAMAERKRAALERIGRPDTHRVMELDALKPDGPQSLAAVAETLDTGAGLAIITEGLLSYLPRDAVLDLWGRFATTLAAFAGGLYIADLHVDADAPQLAARAVEALLSVFVRGRVAVHFETAGEAEQALRDAGFGEAHVRRASEYPQAGEHQAGDLVRIVEASLGA
jgi:O-methyltransferase involved in polyketide biosynthesis